MAEVAKAEENTRTTTAEDNVEPVEEGRVDA